MLFAALVAAAVLAVPVPARAEGTVRVEVYVGDAAACGAGFFIWFAQSLEMGLGAGEPARALVNLRGRHMTAASPLWGLRWLRKPWPGDAPLDLFRWEF